MKKVFVTIGIIVILAATAATVVWWIFFRVKVSLVYAKSITFIEANNDYLKIDEEGSLKRTVRVKVLPSKTNNKGVDFVSSNPSAVRVTRITDTEAEVELLELGGSAVITAKTRDGTNLSAGLTVFGGLNTNRTLEFVEDGFAPDAGIFEYQTGFYAFYKDFSYTINGATEISGDFGGNINIDKATVSGNKITFNELGAVSFVLNGEKIIYGYVAERIDIFSTTLKTNDNYIVGTGSTMDFGITAKFLGAQGLEDVDLGESLSAILSKNGSDISSALSKDFDFSGLQMGEKYRVTFKTPCQNNAPIVFDFTLAEGANCFDFEDLKAAFEKTSNSAVVLHGNINITAADMPELVNSARTALISGTESVVLREGTSPNPTFVFYGNGYTLDYSLLPRFAANTSQKFSTDLAALFKIQTDESLTVEHLNIIGNSPDGLAAKEYGLIAFLSNNPIVLANVTAKNSGL